MSELAHIAEIDLIPADYRSERALMRAIRTAGWAVLALVCLAGVLSGALRHAAAGVRSDVERLDAGAARVEAQRAAVAGLAQRKAALEAKVSLLEGLRRHAALGEILLSVNRAVPERQVWFLEWRYQRIGAVVPVVPAGAESYFVAASATSGQDTGTVRVQMTIVGQARDHAAVAMFVSSLLGEPGIEEVQIRGVSREIGANTVDFEVLVVAHGGRVSQ